MKQRGTIVIFILIVCISGLLMFGRLTRGHNWGGDFSAYIMQAKSITEGAPRAFIESNRFTIWQSSRMIGPTAYPWGFPILLAPFYATFGLNPLALKAVVISYLLFLVVLWFGFRRDHTTPGFLCLVCLFGLNPTFLAFSNNILSDLPFLLISTVCVLLIREIIVKDHCIISRRADLILLGVGIAFAFTIRTNGILLIVTLGLSHVISYLQKQSLNEPSHNTGWGYNLLGSFFFPKHPSVKPITLLLNPYVVFFCSVIIWRLFLPEGGTSRLIHWKDISARMVINNMSYYFDLASRFFSGAPYSRFFYVASIFLAIAGAIRRYRSDYPAIIYMALTVLLYSFYPGRQGLRFLFPIFPFYLSFAVSGLEAFGDGMTGVWSRIWKVLSCCAVILVMLFFVGNDLRSVYRNYVKHGETASGPFAPASQEMFCFITNHIEADAVVVFFKPRVMRLMTGRKSIMVDRAEQLSRGDYLCLYLRKSAYNQVQDGKVEHLLARGAVRLEYENDDFKVYRITKVREHIAHNNAMHTDGNFATPHSSW